ncbi:DUF1513 domain-containing protein [Gemmobacter serpentinus]|uniref:DUF1513 domain-containing protein n=1 Tax=Gemmobacter serpentinus TaxID=2652247 RepID=UPI00124CA0F1|nr:DUF1513 domain-containing protein [Gemmobacter serpentinus]
MRRRNFLTTLAAIGAMPRLSWADIGSPAYLAAAQTPDGSYSLHGLSLAGESLFALPLPARGHAATAHPERPHAVAFARRPGSYALVLDCARGQALARLTPPEGRQFNGHGAYSLDGSVLYTSEQLAENSEGRVGLWESATYTRIGEIPTHGIGPHELRRLPLSEDLLIANGGIATDPTDRTKLNIDTMRPNLARVTPEGKLVSLAEPPPELHQNSLRHLALLPDGRAACAMQWEGDPAEYPALLALWDEGRITLHEPSLEDSFAMDNYAGSIAYSPATGEIGLTSPKGGVVQIHGADGSYLRMVHRADACGLAASPDGFTLTDGNGAISTLRPGGLELRQNLGLQWDNHLIALAT